MFGNTTETDIKIGTANKETHMKHTYELVSFDLCPYVQKAVIALKWKKAEFKTTYIDLFNPPEWFDAISPLGQVPVLKVDEKHAIFESSVISELLDETIEPRLHHADPIERAKERAWIEYGSSLLAEQGAMFREKDLKTAEGLKKELFESVARLETILGNGPYFRGKDFSLVDAAYAPFFLRLSLVPSTFSAALFQDLPKTKAWADTLLALPEVKESVPADFKEKFLKLFLSFESAILSASH
jgi:glutathione S-transferase